MEIRIICGNTLDAEQHVRQPGENYIKVAENFIRIKVCRVVFIGSSVFVTALIVVQFPILRPSGWRLAERTKRLKSQRQQVEAERRLHYHQLKEDTSQNLPALIGMSAVVANHHTMKMCEDT